MTATITRLNAHRFNDSPARWQRALKRANAEGDRVCKHRAKLREKLGLLVLEPDPEPAPTAPAIVPLPRRHPVVEIYEGGHLIARAGGTPLRPAA